MPLDPDILDHISREAAFAAEFSWPPADAVSDLRPARLLEPWSIDREAALRALVAPAADDSSCETAIIALWLMHHSRREIRVLRVLPIDLQHERIFAWSESHILVSERGALLDLVNRVFQTADATKTLPAYEKGSGSGNVRRP